MDTPGVEGPKGPTKRTVKASKEVIGAYAHAMAMSAGLEIAQRAAGASMRAAVTAAVKEHSIPSDTQVSYSSETEEVSWLEWPS